MTLQKIISGLLKNSTQEALADKLGLDPRRGQQTISNMLKAGSTWEKHWAIFLKLLPLIAAEDLHPSVPEVIAHALKTQTNGKKKTVPAKARSLGAVQARRLKGG